jgi:hypothetical protein
MDDGVAVAIAATNQRGCRRAVVLWTSSEILTRITSTSKALGGLTKIYRPPCPRQAKACVGGHGI